MQDLVVILVHANVVLVHGYLCEPIQKTACQRIEGRYARCILADTIEINKGGSSNDTLECLRQVVEVQVVRAFAVVGVVSCVVLTQGIGHRVRGQSFTDIFVVSTPVHRYMLHCESSSATEYTRDISGYPLELVPIVCVSVSDGPFENDTLPVIPLMARTPGGSTIVVGPPPDAFDYWVLSDSGCLSGWLEETDYEALANYTQCLYPSATPRPAPCPTYMCSPVS